MFIIFCYDCFPYAEREYEYDAKIKEKQHEMQNLSQRILKQALIAMEIVPIDNSKKSIKFPGGLPYAVFYSCGKSECKGFMRGAKRIPYN